MAGRDTNMRVLSNTFALEKAPVCDFYQYDVTFNPEAKNVDHRRRIIHRIQTELRPDLFQPAAPYDGRANLYLSKMIPQQTIEVPLGRKPPRMVTIKPVGTIRTSTIAAMLSGKSGYSPNEVLNAMTFLNVAIRHAPATSGKNTFNGRSFFPKSDEYGAAECDLSYGIHAVRGYFQSVRLGSRGLLVNLDVTAAAMYKSQSLVDFLMQHFRLRNVRDLMPPNPNRSRDDYYAWLERFTQWQRAVKNLKIYLSYGKFKNNKEKPKTIKGLVEEGAMHKFQNENGGEMTVEKYFRDTYQLTLKLPQAIAVKIGSDNVIPIEFCFLIPGQFYKKPLPPDATKSMVEFTTSKPQQRLESIKNAIPLLEYQSSPVVRGSGIEVSTRPMEVEGTLMAPPKLMFKTGTEIPRLGSWNFRDNKVHAPVKISSYGVLVFAPRQVRRDDAARNIKNLMDACRNMGLLIHPADPPIMVVDGQGNFGKIAQDLRAVCESSQGFQSRLELIIAILPDSADGIRKQVKQFGDIEQGVATQCLRATKFMKKGNDDQYLKNVGLKINAKLGGINSLVDGAGMAWIKKEPTIILGADVSHPGPTSKAPSVTALVSSVNNTVTRYVASTKPQESRQEKILDLGEMFEHSLNMFHTFNAKDNIWPQRIVFYRDGLSEGEFDVVAKEELDTLRATVEGVKIKNGLKGWKPEFIYIIAIKHHHIRFFPSGGSTDKSSNVPAGFVANQGVTGPISGSQPKDWFLQSHAGIQGTSRPTHYVIFQNDSTLTSDNIQHLTFELCHNYARATRSVSVVAPVYCMSLDCI